MELLPVTELLAHLLMKQLEQPQTQELLVVQDHLTAAAAQLELVRRLVKLDLMELILAELLPVMEALDHLLMKQLEQPQTQEFLVERANLTVATLIPNLVHQLLVDLETLAQLT